MLKRRCGTREACAATARLSHRPVGRAPRGVRAAWAVCAFLARSDAAGGAARKREGDGATPIGRWRLRGCSIAPDRVRRPRTAPAGAARSAAATAGATRPATATTIARCAIPIRPAPSGCGARTRSTTSWSCWATTSARACAAAAAPSSCTWPGPAMRRPRAASRCAREHLLRLLERLGPVARVASRVALKKSARSFRSGR